MYRYIITITLLVCLQFICYTQDSNVYSSEYEIQKINRENVELIKIRNDYLKMLDSLTLISKKSNINTHTSDSLLLDYQNIELDRLKHSNTKLRQSLRELVYIIDALQIEMTKSSEKNKTKQE